MVVVPAETPITTPDALTVATAVLDDVHAPPVLPFEVNVVVPLAQMAVVPAMVPAFGVAVTVIVVVADTFAQPPVPVMV